MDREDVVRRLKAARMLGGYKSPGALCQHELMVKNQISESRVRELEWIHGRGAEAKPMELAVIAEACGLPEEWFSAPFARLADQTSTDERLAALEKKVDRLAQAPPPDAETLRREAARQAAEDAGARSRPEHGGQTQPG